MLSIIVAFDESRGIGKDNKLPWHLPEDLKLFKERTLGHSLIMGANTFIGMGAPLKERFTYVINEDALKPYDNVTYITDLDSFIQECLSSSEEFFVCGGSSIYKQLLPYCEKMYISKISGTFDTDTFFPDFDVNKWDVIKVSAYEGFIVEELQRSKIV